MLPTPKWGMEFKKAPVAVQASLEPILRFFSWHDAHPVALTMALMEKFSHDWIEWEPETLKKEIITTFRATSVSEHNWTKIQAIRTLLRTVGFWNEWHLFEKVIHSLNNNIPRFDIAQPCSVAQLMAGVDIANQIRKEKYEEEIVFYVKACAIEAGVTYLPEPLEFAQEALSEPSYVCEDCGNVDTDDLSDGRCDFCVGRFHDDHPFNRKALEGIPKEVGTRIKKFLKRDPSAAKKRFEEVRDQQPKDVHIDPSSAVDVQAAKLVVAYRYMTDRRAQLVSQLEELRSWVSH